MATCNFSIENRCIVVTPEDFDFENVPDLGKNLGRRGYELDQYESKFNFFNIVLVYGYYEGASIDFVERHDAQSLDNIYYYVDFATKKDLFAAVHEDFDISISKLQKACKNKTVAECFEIIDNIIIEIERAECNKILDQIKKDFGYKEYKAVATFSNGETIYKEIA